MACGRHSVITYGVNKNGNVLDDILIGCMAQGKRTEHALPVTPARGRSALKRLRTRFPTHLHTILTPASPNMHMSMLRSWLGS